MTNDTTNDDDDDDGMPDWVNDYPLSDSLVDDSLIGRSWGEAKQRGLMFHWVQNKAKGKACKTCGSLIQRWFHDQYSTKDPNYERPPQGIKCARCIVDMYRSGWRPSESAGRAPDNAPSERQVQLRDYLMSSVRAITVRGVYYITVQGWVKKTNEGYNAIINDLKRLRKRKWLDYDKIIDNTRQILGGFTIRSPIVWRPTEVVVAEKLDPYGGGRGRRSGTMVHRRRGIPIPSLDELIPPSAEELRLEQGEGPKPRWQEHENWDEHVLVFIEKDALGSVIADECRRYEVPLVIARGNNSIDISYRVATRILEVGNIIFPSPSFSHSFNIASTASLTGGGLPPY